MVIVSIAPAIAANGDVYRGKVVHVSDGNTFTMIYNNRKLKVRFVHAFAPALDQPNGMQAKKALGNRIFGRTVEVIERAQIDGNGIVGQVFLDQQEITDGMAVNNAQ